MDTRGEGSACPGAPGCCVLARRHVGNRRGSQPPTQRLPVMRADRVVRVGCTNARRVTAVLAANCQLPAYYPPARPARRPLQLGNHDTSTSANPPCYAATCQLPTASCHVPTLNCQLCLAGCILCCCCHAHPPRPHLKLGDHVRDRDTTPPRANIQPCQFPTNSRANYQLPAVLSWGPSRPSTSSRTSTPFTPSMPHPPPAAWRPRPRAPHRPGRRRSGWSASWRSPANKPGTGSVGTEWIKVAKNVTVRGSPLEGDN